MFKSKSNPLPIMLFWSGFALANYAVIYFILNYLFENGFTLKNVSTASFIIPIYAVAVFTISLRMVRYFDLGTTEIYQHNPDNERKYKRALFVLTMAIYFIPLLNFIPYAASLIFTVVQLLKNPKVFLWGIYLTNEGYLISSTLNKIVIESVKTHREFSTTVDNSIGKIVNEPITKESESYTINAGLVVMKFVYDKVKNNYSIHCIRTMHEKEVIHFFNNIRKADFYTMIAITSKVAETCMK